MVVELSVRPLSDHAIEGREAAWGVMKVSARLLLDVRSELITRQIQRLATISASV
jgi:hypothetical protein